MSHWTEPTAECGCGRTLQLVTVHPAVPGAKAVRGAMCPTCDRRRCKCEYYVQDGFARRCPKCHRDLMSA